MSLTNYLSRALDQPWFFDLIRDVLDGGQVPHIMRILSSVRPKRVLDIACGTGRISMAVSPETEYVGIDISDAFIAHAVRSQGGPRKEFRVMDALDIRLPRKGFDLVMLVSVIHHFTDEEVVRVLTQAAELASKFVLVVDAVPKRNPVSRIFYAMDRGAHIRTFAEQRALIVKTKCLEIIREESFESTSRIYTHSVLLTQVNERV